MEAEVQKQGSRKALRARSQKPQAAAQRDSSVNSHCSRSSSIFNKWEQEWQQLMQKCNNSCDAVIHHSLMKNACSRRTDELGKKRTVFSEERLQEWQAVEAKVIDNLMKVNARLRQLYGPPKTLKQRFFGKQNTSSSVNK